MPPITWRKTSYRPEGDSCVRMAEEPASGAIRLTGTGGPRAAVLTAAPAALRSFPHALKEEHDRG
jgi:hypothetical protein